MQPTEQVGSLAVRPHCIADPSCEVGEKLPQLPLVCSCGCAEGRGTHASNTYLPLAKAPSETDVKWIRRTVTCRQAPPVAVDGRCC
jgi:hypothetical protein